MFIQNAFAEPAPAAAAGAGAPPGFESMFFVLALFVVFYFMMIRPQMKRQKEHRKMIAEIKVGDEVVVAGGLAGRVARVTEQYLAVEIADGVEVKVQKGAVGQLLPKGTLKSI
ncbi:preprotein translocase subunit YajC [Immundisolibacter sp.]|uniref:preprotein translocase subunit YajC n=1 Tax=Immundisolibacter sp. TaxID=1934948 RepID=UPI00198FA680|nr:preprotein translocase subunit YajC [Immundisolibacter sp.]